MNKQDRALVKVGSKIKYTGPTTKHRIKDKVYVVNEIHNNPNFVSHETEMKTQGIQHLDQYDLIKNPIETTPQRKQEILTKFIESSIIETSSLYKDLLKDIMETPVPEVPKVPTPNQPMKSDIKKGYKLKYIGKSTNSLTTNKIYEIESYDNKYFNHLNDMNLLRTESYDKLNEYEIVDQHNFKVGDKFKSLTDCEPARLKNKIYTINKVDGNNVWYIGEYNLETIITWFDQVELVKEVKEMKEVKEIKVETLPAVYQESEVKNALANIQDLSTKIMEMSLKQSQTLAKDLINDVQKQLDEVKRKSAQVLKVQINESETKELKTQAVPYLKRMIISAKLNKNIMLVGPAGCGKTTAASQLAEALGLKFYNLTFTAGASETWLFGRQTPNGFIDGSFWLAYKNGGVFLADEFDAGDANLVLSINTAIENGHCFNPINGENINRHKDFVLVAACNTFGKGADATYTGRNRLDAASLRRFAGSVIQVDYNEDIEEMLCPDKTIRTALQNVRKELIKIGSNEIVSTGCIKNVWDLMQNGITFKVLAESLCLSWPDDLKPLMKQAVKEVKGTKDSDEVPF